MSGRDNQPFFETTDRGESAVDLGNHAAETDSVAGHIGFEVRRETGKE
jgi:hypothetical protein